MEPERFGIRLVSAIGNNATGFAGEAQSNDDIGKQIVGIDLSGDITPKSHWFAQGLWSQKENCFLIGIDLAC